MSYAAITEARLHAAEQVLAEALTSLPETISATSEVRDGDPAERSWFTLPSLWSSLVK
jgi:hypothetical protein